MKAIIRLLVIVLAIVTVVGATWAVGQASSSGSDSVVMAGTSSDFGDSETRPAPLEGMEFDGGDQHAAQFTSVQGWLGFAKSLVPIAIIIALVTVPMNLWKRYQRSHKHLASTPVG